MVMRRTDVFQLPPEQDPNAPVDPSPFGENISKGISDVLQAASVYIAQSRIDVKELKMKVSELSTKVDTLISVATDIKAAQAAVPAVGAPAVVEDDPEIQRLADRIDAAISVLKGEQVAVAPTPVAPPVAEPAPVAAPAVEDPNVGLPPPPSPV